MIEFVYELGVPGPKFIPFFFGADCLELFFDDVNFLNDDIKLLNEELESTIYFVEFLFPYFGVKLALFLLILLHLLLLILAVIALLRHVLIGWRHSESILRCYLLVGLYLHLFMQLMVEVLGLYFMLLLIDWLIGLLLVLDVIMHLHGLLWVLMDGNARMLEMLVIVALLIGHLGWLCLREVNVHSILVIGGTVGPSLNDWTCTM